MSGGSYDYLCRNTDDLSSRVYLVERMRDTLTQMGYSRAAEDTEAVLRHLRAAVEQAEQLYDVWHAVEWYASNDYSREQVDDAVAEYAPGECSNCLREGHRAEWCPDGI